MGTPLQKSLGSSQDTEIKWATVTRHKTRPLRDRRPLKFSGDRLFTSAITSGSTHVNVMGAAQNTSDEELGKKRTASSSARPRTVNKSRGGGNINLSKGAGTG